MSVISGIVGPSMAADAQTDAATMNAKTQTDIYNKNIALQQPFYNQGLRSLPYLQAYTGVDMGGSNIGGDAGPMPQPPDIYANPMPESAGHWENVSAGEGQAGTVPQWVPDKLDPAVWGAENRKKYDDYNRAMAEWTTKKNASNIAPVTLPPYEDTVTKPMDSWRYEQSPAYQAKYTLGMEELNKQLQARGLASSGVGANRAADLARNLTASDYGAERSYELGRKTDLYKSRYSENADRYNRLLDQIKMATGASSSMGQAGNQYATGIGNATRDAGEAKANFYSGLGGLTTQTANTGLKAYDYGNKQGWWGQGANDAGVTAAGADAAATAYAPEMAADYGVLYGL